MKNQAEPSEPSWSVATLTADVFVVLLALGFAAWTLSTMATVAGLRDDVAERVGWLMAVQGVRVATDPHPEHALDALAARIDAWPTATPAEREAARAAVQGGVGSQHLEALTTHIRAANGAASVELGRMWQRMNTIALLAIALSIATVAMLLLTQVQQRRVLASHQRLGRTVRALEAEHERRERSERVRDQLVAVVSHELRTPLTAILGALSLQIHGLGARKPGADDDLLEIAHRNAERMAQLVDDLLDLKRLSEEGVALELAPVELDALLRDAVAQLEPMAEARQVVLELVEPVPGRATADRKRLMQVVANLVSNAVKVSQAGDRVALSTSEHGARVSICVRDEGPGIPLELQERIFQPFVQADTSARRATGGTGLGLAISRGLVHRMGGSIGCESTPGAGATFTIELSSA